MSRLARCFGMLLVAFLAMPGCDSDSPFIKGWRDDKQDQRTDQEKCEASKGYKWIDGSCQKADSLDLTKVSEADCQKIENTSWRDNQCVAHKDLKTAAACQSVGWSWADERCMLRAEAECRADANSDWVEDHCVTRPTLTLAGTTTQVLAVGGSFQPLTITVSPGAAAQLENQTCAGFFKIEADLILSTPAKGAAGCEADVIAAKDGARSLAVHLKATVDEGFLSLCKKFENQEAARKERTLARTVLTLKTATEKATCDEAAAALAEVTDLEIEGRALVDLRPLTGLTKLQALKLPNNEVRDLTPVAYLPQLVTLVLAGNPIAAGGFEKTEKNCPTNENVNFAVADFCLGR